MNKLNKNIKDKLYDYSPVVDNDALWDALEDHVPVAQKKRRFLPFWFFLGGLCMVGIALYSINSNSDSIIEESPLKTQQIITDQYLNKEIANKNVVAKEVNSSLNNEASDAKKDLNQSHLNRKNNNRNSESHISSMHDKKINTRIFQEQKVVLTDKINEQNVEQNLEPILVIDKQVGEYDEVERRGDINEIAPINGIVLTPLVFEEQITMDGIRPLVKGNRNKLWLQYGIGMGKSYQIINTFGDDPINNLDEHYKMMPTLDFSINLGYQITPKLSIVSGINYLRITSRLSTDVNNITQSFENGVTTTVIDGGGNETEITGQIEISNATSYSATWHTYHQYISVPIGVQFDLLGMNKFNLALSGGVNTNLFGLHNGAILNSDQELNKFGQNSSPYIGAAIAPYGGVGIEYKLRNGAIGLQSRIAYNKNSYSITNHKIDENFITNSLKLTFTHFIK